MSYPFNHLILDTVFGVYVPFLYDFLCRMWYLSRLMQLWLIMALFVLPSVHLFFKRACAAIQLDVWFLEWHSNPFLLIRRLLLNRCSMLIRLLQLQLSNEMSRVVQKSFVTAYKRKYFWHVWHKLTIIVALLRLRKHHFNYIETL